MRQQPRYYVLGADCKRILAMYRTVSKVGEPRTVAFMKP